MANAALRFEAPASLLPRWRAAHPGTAAAGALAGPGATDGAGAATLWYLDSAGAPQLALVHAGLSDGLSTEVSGASLRAGLEVIAGEAAAARAPTGAASPFQGGRSNGGGGPPPPGGV